MENIALIETFLQFKEDKKIDRATLMTILEDVFRAMLTKIHGSDENFDIIVNPDKGDLEIWHNREIVADGEVEDKSMQIAYTEAIEIEPDFEVGEEVSEQVFLQDFGRRAILALRQSLKSRLMEHDNAELFKRYNDMVGSVVVGEVHHISGRGIIVLDEEDKELSLPKDQQIPSDFFRKGDTVRAIVNSVEFRGNKPVVVLSRTAPGFLEYLFEQEIPEVADGVIIVKKVERIPGEKAKVAVESYDDRIDPVGACVGMKGSRIHGIVRELGNENIDVINYTDNTKLFITRALSPAKITSLEVDEENMKVDVYLKPDQVSLAIGRSGHNIRLAGRLTGFEIDVYRDTDEAEDVSLTEFSDEIDEWILAELRKVGCDTARSVLELEIADLVKRTDLEEETAERVRSILSAEFE